MRHFPRRIYTPQKNNWGIPVLILAGLCLTVFAYAELHSDKYTTRDQTTLNSSKSIILNRSSKYPCIRAKFFSDSSQKTIPCLACYGESVDQTRGYYDMKLSNLVTDFIDIDSKMKSGNYRDEAFADLLIQFSITYYFVFVVRQNGFHLGFHGDIIRCPACNGSRQISKDEIIPFLKGFLQGAKNN